MKRVLVLGGNGFIGSHLVDALAARAIHTRVFGRSHPDSIADNTPFIERIEGDFTHESDVCSALEGCDICFHFVSTTLPKSSNDNPIFDVQTNIGGTLKLLNHAVRCGVKKVIFLSSGGTIYGIPKKTPIDESHPTEPICSYGVTKLAIEKYLELYRVLHGLDYTVIRLSNPYGERQRLNSTQGAVAVFLNRLLKNTPIEIWGDGSIVRDYLHISDVVSALLKAMDYRGDQHIFNIGAGEGKSINQLIDTIEIVTGRRAERIYKASRPFDVPISVLSIARAEALLDWKPQVSFDEGLERTAKWIISRS